MKTYKNSNHLVVNSTATKKSSPTKVIPDTLSFVIEETLIMGMLISMFCLV